MMLIVTLIRIVIKVRKSSPTNGTSRSATTKSKSITKAQMPTQTNQAKT